MSAQQLARQFEKLLKLLHQGQAYSSGAGNEVSPALGATYMSCQQHVSVIRDQPAAPRATWKKLLQQQVPSKVLRLCGELIISPTWQKKGMAKAAIAITSATAVFIAAENTGFLLADHCSSSSSSSSVLNSLGVSLRQQVEQSGFLQQLPALLTATADELERMLAAATNQDAGPSGDEAASFREAAWQHVGEQQSRSLLWLLAKVCGVLPNFLSSHAVGSSCLLPVARLAIGAVRYVSTKSAGQPQAAAGANPSTSTEAQLESSSVGISALAYQTALNAVRQAKRWVMAADSSGHAGSALQHAEEVLYSPYILQCLCFLAAATALTPLVAQSCVQQHQERQRQQRQQEQQQEHKQEQQQQQEPQGGSGSNQPDHIPTCQVPQPVEEMLQQLGCSKQVALSVASLWCQLALHTGVQKHQLPADEASVLMLSAHGLSDLIALYSHMFVSLDERLKKDPRAAHGMLDSQAVGLLTALPAVLLQLPASIPISSGAFAECCCCCLPSLFKTFTADVALVQGVGHSIKLQANTMEQQEQQPGEGQQQQNEGSVCLPAFSSQAINSLPQPWQLVSSVLPLFCQIFSGLCQLRRFTACQATAGQPRSADVSAQSQGGQWHSGPMSPKDVLITSLDGAIVMFVAVAHAVERQLLPAARKQGEGELESVSAAQHSVAQGAVSNASPPTVDVAVAAGQLCSLLEDLVRAETAVSLAVFSSSSSNPPAAGAAGGGRVHWNLVLSDGLEIATEHKRLLQRLGCIVGTDNNKVPDSANDTLLEPILAAGTLSSSPMAPPAAQLYGLLCSMLKASACSAGHSSLHSLLPLLDDTCSARYLIAVCSAAARVVVRLSTKPESAFPAATNRAALPPWLVLLGRCCLQLGPYCINVKQAAGSVEQEQQQEQQQEQEQPSESCSQHDSEALQEEGPLRMALRTVGWVAKALLQWEAGITEEGSCSSTPQTLADWGGCDTQLLFTQHLQALAAAHAECDTACSDTDGGAGCSTPTDTAINNLAQQLQVVGAALTSIAMPYACNNARCLNVSGSAEAQLVGGRSCICAGCRTARFCGKPCQVASWKQHKPVCKALAAAAAAKAAGG